MTCTKSLCTSLEFSLSVRVLFSRTLNTWSLLGIRGEHKALSVLFPVSPLVSNLDQSQNYCIYLPSFRDHSLVLHNTNQMMPAVCIFCSVLVISCGNVNLDYRTSTWPISCMVFRVCL